MSGTNQPVMNEMPILMRTLSISVALMAASLLLGGCSTAQIVARGASPIIDYGVTAMNRETDYELARASIPANIKMIEALLLADPGNTAYRIQAAMAFYGYSMAFVDEADSVRAIKLYQRAMAHAEIALTDAGVTPAMLKGQPASLDAALAKLDVRAVPALFWTASAWAKLIELQLDEPERLAELPRVEALMRRALVLDEAYYHGSAHVFFGVYYGGRAPMFGGDFVRSAQHFDRAAQLTQNRMLWIDVYRAQYLQRQMNDRAAFHQTLSKVVNAPDSAKIDPDLNFANMLAKRKAAELLAQEEDLF